MPSSPFNGKAIPGKCSYEQKDSCSWKWMFNTFHLLVSYKNWVPLFTVPPNPLSFCGTFWIYFYESLVPETNEILLRMQDFHWVRTGLCGNFALMIFKLESLFASLVCKPLSFHPYIKGERNVSKIWRSDYYSFISILLDCRLIPSLSLFVLIGVSAKRGSKNSKWQPQLCNWSPTSFLHASVRTHWRRA